MNLEKIQKSQHLRNYGESLDVLKLFKEKTNKNESDAIKSLSNNSTGFETRENFNAYHLTYEGQSIRCISKYDENFYSIESINIDKNNLIEGITKYIGYQIL